MVLMVQQKKPDFKLLITLPGKQPFVGLEEECVVKDKESAQTDKSQPVVLTGVRDGATCHNC